MEVQLINDELLRELANTVVHSDRKRLAYDLSTTPDSTSQRILNSLTVGTEVPIHRHENTSETIICIKGMLDVVFYVDMPNMDAGGPGREFQETARFRVCPREGTYGIQVPQGAWHSVIVHEPSTILEAKDGPYISPK